MRQAFSFVLMPYPSYFAVTSLQQRYYSRITASLLKTHRLIPVNKVFVLYGGPLYIRFYSTASVNTTVPNVYSTGIVSVNFDFIPLTADDVAVSGGLSPISLPVVSEILTL